MQDKVYKLDEDENYKVYEILQRHGCFGDIVGSDLFFSKLLAF